MLVDAGPDLREQALRHRIARVDAIVFTHGHADHILGMDDVRRFNALMRGSMPCYGDAATLEDIRRMFSYVFDPATPKGGGLPQLDLLEIEGPFTVGDLACSRCRSGTATGGFSDSALGGFAYLTDCNRIDEAPGRCSSAWTCSCSTRCAKSRTRRTSRWRRHRRDRGAIGAARDVLHPHGHDLPHEATNARLPAGMRLAHDGLVLRTA